MDQWVTKVFGGALRAEIPYITNSYSTAMTVMHSTQGDPLEKNPLHSPLYLIKSTKDHDILKNSIGIPHTYTQTYTFPHNSRKSERTTPPGSSNRYIKGMHIKKPQEKEYTYQSTQ